MGKLEEKIIEKFDKKFVENKREDGPDYTLYLRDDDIKKFLRQELLSYRREIEKAKKKRDRSGLTVSAEIKGSSINY